MLAHVLSDPARGVADGLVWARAQQPVALASLSEVLDPHADQSPVRLQSFLVSGHKADFGFIAFDPNPLKLDRLHQRLLASPVGPALEAVDSFVSLTEISEYVPSPEQYAAAIEVRW